MYPLSDLWHRFGYRLLYRKYRKQWGEPGKVQYRGFIAQRILICLPPLNGPIQDAIRAVLWFPSLFPDAEIRVVHYDEVSGSLPQMYRSWGALGRHHFNSFGLPKRTFLDEIRNWNADMAVDLSDPADEVTDFICAMSGSRWHAALLSAADNRFVSSGNVLVIPSSGTSRQERYGVLLRYLSQAK